MRAANFAKSASTSTRLLALSSIVLRRSASLISLKRPRRSSDSICSGVRTSSRPAAAKAMRLRSSSPFQR